jgi:hypothetical protein
VARKQPRFSLRDMWLTVSHQLSKNTDFRGLRVVEAHLRRLEQRGEVRAVSAEEFQWSG